MLRSRFYLLCLFVSIGRFLSAPGYCPPEYYPPKKTPISPLGFPEDEPFEPLARLIELGVYVLSKGNAGIVLGAYIAIGLFVWFLHDVVIPPDPDPRKRCRGDKKKRKDGTPDPDDRPWEELSPEEQKHEWREYYRRSGFGRPIRRPGASIGNEPPAVPDEVYLRMQKIQLDEIELKEQLERMWNELRSRLRAENGEEMKDEFRSGRDRLGENLSDYNKQEKPPRSAKQSGVANAHMHWKLQVLPRRMGEDEWDFFERVYNPSYLDPTPTSKNPHTEFPPSVQGPLPAKPLDPIQASPVTPASPASPASPDSPDSPAEESVQQSSESARPASPEPKVEEPPKKQYYIEHVYQTMTDGDYIYREPVTEEEYLEHQRKLRDSRPLMADSLKAAGYGRGAPEQFSEGMYDSPVSQPVQEEKPEDGWPTYGCKYDSEGNLLDFKGRKPGHPKYVPPGKQEIDPPPGLYSDTESEKGSRSGSDEDEAEGQFESPF